MAISTMQDLFLDQLRDLYSVESQLIPALRELAETTDNTRLRTHLEQHARDTETQKARLDSIAKRHGWELDGDPSKAIVGLIKGGHAHIDDAEGEATRDFLLIAHSHRVEHYELAAYSIVVELAGELEFREEEALLRASLDEERAMDDSLTQLAKADLLHAIPR